jgi:predicted ferric reductase
MPTQQSASAALPPRPNRWRFPDPRVTSEVVLWMLVFLVVVAAPIAVAMMPGPTTRPAGVLRDFASALGYAGVSMIGVLFALTARFPRATAQFGIDVVFHFHRWLALLAIVVILAHAGIVLTRFPDLMPTFNPLVARGSLTAACVALLFFVVMAVWSLARKLLAERKGPKHWASEYDNWRRGHALLATTAYALLLWHVIDRAPSLDNGSKKLFWIAYTALGLVLIVWVRFFRPSRRTNRRWIVEDVREEVPQVWTVRLKARSPRPLRFLPGQFVWLTLHANRYAMCEHPFSIASAAHPGGTNTIELTIRECGNFTETIHSLQRGEIVWIDGPFGRFTTTKRPNADAYVLVAGNTGIVPIMSMLRTAADEPLAMGRKRYVLFYFTRQGKPVLFRDELDALSRQMNAGLKVVHVETSGKRDGYITAEFVQHHLPDCATGRYECFICAPSALTSEAERALQAAGISGSRIHQELFEWV